MSDASPEKARERAAERIEAVYRRWYGHGLDADAADAMAAAALDEAPSGPGASREQIVEALMAAPEQCCERHYGPGPFSHRGCVMQPDYEAMADAVLRVVSASVAPSSEAPDTDGRETREA